MRTAAGILALLGLAACQTGIEADPVAVSAPLSVPVSASAGPGPVSASLAFGADVLQSACIDTRPSFDGASAALAQIGSFVQNSQTGTYYSQRFDLSVKVIPGRCSLVMGGQYPADSVARVRGATAPADAVRSGRSSRVGGKTYLSFFVAGE